VRFTRADVDDPKAHDCLAHRCVDHPDQHETVPPVNSTGPSGSECALCVAHEFIRVYDTTMMKTLFWPIVETARNRLNLLSPGAGDSFQDHARVTVNSLKVLSEVLTDEQEDKEESEAQSLKVLLDTLEGFVLTNEYPFAERAKDALDRYKELTT
jgi:hypothetical protein